MTATRTPRGVAKFLEVVLAVVEIKRLCCGVLMGDEQKKEEVR
jgi:hypothetical protein